MPYLIAVCGVRPNCANTGMPARVERAHHVGKFGRGIDLDHVGAAFLDEPDRRRERAVDALLHRTEGHVAADQRALDAAAHRLAADQHLVHRDFERIVVAPQIDADRIADRDEIDAGAVGDARDLIIPGDDADALLALALHLRPAREWSSWRPCCPLCPDNGPPFSTAPSGRLNAVFAGPARAPRSGLESMMLVEALK